MAGDSPSPSPSESFRAMDEEATDTLPRSTPGRTEKPCEPEDDRLVIRIALKDEMGEHLPGVPYRLVVGDETWERDTDDQGLVEQEVPATATTGRLELWKDGDLEAEPEVMELLLAQMDPAAMETGREARLANLGFTGHDPDEEPDVSVEEALDHFTLWSGLDEPGVSDGEDARTQERLETFYGPLNEEPASDPFEEIHAESTP